jgi:hypothetical protein
MTLNGIWYLVCQSRAEPAGHKLMLLARSTHQVLLTTRCCQEDDTSPEVILTTGPPS